MSTRQLASDVLLFHARGDGETRQQELDLSACFRSLIFGYYTVFFDGLPSKATT